MRELSEIQSTLALKEQRFRHSVLRFSSPPRNCTDPPSELDAKHSPTAQFIDYRTKDLPTLYTRVVTLLPIGHYDADRRRERLVEDIETCMREAVSIELQAWRNEMVKHRVGVSANGPEIVATGK